MIYMCAIGSGSQGNAIIVGNEKCKILIDCGFQLNKLANKLLEVGLSPYDIDAIVVTHEHNDHIKGVVDLSDKCKIPLYMATRTHAVIKNKSCTGNINDAKPLQYVKTFVCPTEIDIKGIKVEPFRISHDAVYPVGYSFSDEDSKAVYATDLGAVTPTVEAAAMGADLIMIESNYDFEMLRRGKYPVFLKTRIQGIKGHLSNNNCGEFVVKLYNTGTKNFILGHISQQNNLPEIAYATTVDALSKAGAVYGKDYNLFVAEQDTPTRRIYCKYEENKMC